MKARWSEKLSGPLMIGLLGALWLAPLLPDPNSFPIWHGSRYSDLVISHWPNALFIRHSLSEWGQLPMWNPMILAGSPFAADPLSGLWYPPFWLLILSPTALTANLITWIHLAWAGWGAWKLARSEITGEFAGVSALAAAAAFSGMPKLLGHIGLGHMGLVSAVCWTPWVVLLSRKAARSLVMSGRGWPFRMAMAGGALGVVFLADPRWLIPAGLLALTIGLAEALTGTGKAKGRIRSLALGGLIAALTCLGIAAVLWLPLFEYYQLSTRHLLTSVEATAMSLPPERLLGFLIPDLGGWPEWLVYPGIVVLMLACVGLTSPFRASKLWGGVALFGILLALGSSTPLYSALASLIPGMSALRVPPRWLFVSGLGMALLSSMGLDQLVSDSRDPIQRKRRDLVVTAVAALVALLAVGLVLLQVDVKLQAAGLGSAVLAVSCALVIRTSSAQTAHPERQVWVVMILLAADLFWVNTTLVERLPMRTVIAEASQAISWVEDSGSAGRTFSPSYAIPQELGGLQGRELADGVNPLQLASYWEYMADAAGFEAGEYSVTLPPYPEGDPSAPWDVNLDGDALGLLAVTHVVSSFSIRGSGIQIASVRNGLSVYEITDSRPHAWVAEDAGDPGGAWHAPSRLVRTPNVITASAEGPGMIVFSEIVYPGWRAVVDGSPARIEVVAGLLRGVRLTPGSHEIILRFRPVTVYAGAAITLLSLAGLAVLWRRR